MEEQPMISIITTVHNLVENNEVENFRLLVKLLSLQTYKNIEHIVIDKLSNDGTIDILNEYKQKGQLEYFSQDDTNKFDGYNKGIQFAKGKYITFLTCDDFLHDITGLNDAVNGMESENADFSCSPAYCMHQQGFVFLYIPSVLNIFQVMPCPRQCMIFRKSVLLNENCFDTNFAHMADYDLMIRLQMKKYKGIFVNKNYTTYKLGKTLFKDNELSNSEAIKIYQKNYSELYDMSDEETLRKMVTVSDFPKELLDKLVLYFDPKDKEKFYERCEQMKQIRLKAYAQMNEGKN